MSFVPLLQDAQQQAGQGNILFSILPFVLIIAIFYFFIIRPQNKKQKETEKMISALKKGDKIVTIGGIHGVVNSTKEKTVVVKVDSNTSIEINRSAVAAVVTNSPAKPSRSKKAKSDEAQAVAQPKENTEPQETQPADSQTEQADAAPSEDASSENK